MMHPMPNLQQQKEPGDFVFANGNDTTNDDVQNSVDQPVVDAVVVLLQMLNQPQIFNAFRSLAVKV
jgi:hypothetical protein